MNKQVRKMMFATLALVCALSAIQLPTMAASVTDPMLVYKLQMRRNDLLQRETKLLRDKDDLNKQIDDARRAGETGYVLNDLCSRLDTKYNELQKTRMDLRDVEKYLL
jgi:hypothetical protein